MIHCQTEYLRLVMSPSIPVSRMMHVLDTKESRHPALVQRACRLHAVTLSVLRVQD